MKEKINYSECMKRKCNECRYYESCFKNNKLNIEEVKEKKKHDKVKIFS